MKKNKAVELVVKDYFKYHGFEIKDLSQNIYRLINENDKITNKKIISDSDNQDSNGKYFLLFYINGKNLDNKFAKIDEDILEAIENELKLDNNEYTKIEKTDRIEILVLTNTIENVIKCEKYYTKEHFRNLYQKKNQGHKLNLNTFNIDYKFVPNDEKEDKFNVSIVSRIKSLENVFENNKEIIKGYVVTANLSDLIKIYNKLGDRLFDDNIRYGIKDSLDLENEMCKTLTKSPDMFWYLNNGISLVTKDENFSLNKSTYVTFSDQISIINGAQTVTIASKKYFDGTDEEKENIKKAKVILRITQVINNQDVINDISIGLNRQKAITNYDIYYTFPFVTVLNEIYYEAIKTKEKSDQKIYDYYFEIVKRGSDHYSPNHYKIEQFAQIVKAIKAQDPGNARNGKGIDVKIDDEGPKFTDNTIFVEEIIQSKDKINLFIKNYKAVNYAEQLNLAYEEIKKEYSKSTKIDINSSFLKNADDKVHNVFKYGKWFVIAYIIYIMNEKQTNDFTNFNRKYYTQEELMTKLKDIIIEFSKVYVKNNNTSKSMDANDFKNNTQYNIFCKDKLNITDKLNELIQDLKQNEATENINS